MSPVDPKTTVLVIDDDRLLCDAVAAHLANRGIETIAAHTGAEGLDLCSRSGVDVILLDQKLPDRDGVSLCEPILRDNDRAKIIFISAYPSFDHAVEALRAGASGYLAKPFELEELDHAIAKTLRTRELEKIERFQRYRSDKERESVTLIGKGALFERTMALADAAAPSKAPILITGETGTGKTALGRAIHYRCPGAMAPFVAVNCAALPADLIETELFGHERGAFTGAVTARRGIFEMAEGGTLLLDEIGEMPLGLQSKLLGVIENKRVRRLGGERERSVDVRILASTNEDLSTAISEKRFRRDLCYRLGMIRIHMPALRERREDIPALCGFFLEKCLGKSGCVIPPDELEALERYDWPGNVLELRNVIERVVILQKGPVIRPSQLLSPLDPAAAVSTRPPAGAIASLADVERSHLIEALDRMSGNYTRTALALGISRSTLRRKLKEYGIGRPAAR